MAAEQPEGMPPREGLAVMWERAADDLCRRLRVAAASGNDGIRVVTPGAAVSPLALGSAASITDELLSLEPRQTVDAGAAREIELSIEIDRGLAHRRVPQRLVFGQSLRTRDDVPALKLLIEAGFPPRYHRDVPIRLLVHDRRVAFVALDAADTRAGAFVVRDPALLEVARLLFESVWAHSEPLPLWLPGEQWPPGDPTDNAVLAMLAEGLKDEAIARRLNLSGRTVRRVVAGLEERYGAASRFQLALLAAENRVLPLPATDAIR